MRTTFRPLPVWPHPETKPRKWDKFDSTYRQTLDLLEYEIEKLGGREIVVGAGFRPSDIRLDGLPRANARQEPYTHPGIEVSFDSRYGPQVYAVDRFEDWRANLRAIALGLKALRDLDRWGFARRGQQYAGFAALAAGETLLERGRRLVETAGGVREALKAHHPDVGGTTDDAAAINAWAARLRAGGS